MGVDLDRRDPGEEDVDLSAVGFAGQPLEDILHAVTFPVFLSA